MEKNKKPKSEPEKNIAVVRVRGIINLNHEQRKTFEQLNLHNKNWCVVLKPTKTNQGMIKKVKDFVTWGEIDNDTYKKMIEKRGELYNDRVKDVKSKINYNKYFVHNNKKYKKYIRLSPPKKGYGRKGVKKTFTEGGALGYRKDAINDLILRMI